MFSHIVIGTNDIERSKRFYDAVLGTLGAGEGVVTQAESGHTSVSYQHDGNVIAITQPINDRPATAANGGTIAFKCSSPEQMMKFHDLAVEHGGTSIEDAPGPRARAPGGGQVAYVRDPDGNKLAAIYRTA